MAILKIFLAIFLMSPILFAQTGSSRECDATRREILKINNKVEHLPPRSDVLEVDTIFKDIQRTELDLKTYEKNRYSTNRSIGRSVGEERREYNKYLLAVDKSKELKERSLRVFEFTEDTTEQEVKSQVDRIEKYGSSEEISIYMKENRIVGVGLSQESGDEQIFKFYRIDKQCEVEDISTSAVKPVRKVYKVNSQFCARSYLGSALRARLMNGAPEEATSGRSACEAAGGRFSDGRTHCVCDKKEMIKTRDVYREMGKYGNLVFLINPFVKNCSGKDVRRLPEDEIEDLVEDNGGFIDVGIKSNVRQMLGLCYEKSKILEKATLPHRRQTTPASGQRSGSAN